MKSSPLSPCFPVHISFLSQSVSPLKQNLHLTPVPPVDIAPGDILLAVNGSGVAGLPLSQGISTTHLPPSHSCRLSPSHSGRLSPLHSCRLSPSTSFRSPLLYFPFHPLPLTLHLCSVRQAICGPSGTLVSLSLQRCGDAATKYNVELQRSTTRGELREVALLGFGEGEVGGFKRAMEVWRRVVAGLEGRIVELEKRCLEHERAEAAARGGLEAEMGQRRSLELVVEAMNRDAADMHRALVAKVKNPPFPCPKGGANNRVVSPSLQTPADVSAPLTLSSVLTFEPPTLATHQSKSSEREDELRDRVALLEAEASERSVAVGEQHRRAAECEARAERAETELSRLARESGAEIQGLAWSLEVAEGRLLDLGAVNERLEERVSKQLDRISQACPPSGSPTPFARWESPRESCAS